MFVSGLAGNATDYQVFLDELTRHVRGYLRKRIPHFHEDVEDLVQEILLAVHNTRHTFRPDEPITAWVHAIARYKLMDFFRTRSRRESLHEPLDDHEAIFSESDDEPSDVRRDIGKLLDHLPDKQRLSILHVTLEGLSVAEAARLAGIAPNPEYSLYAATKAGIIALTRAIALELAPYGINVNSIAPGNTETPINAEIRTAPEFAAQRARIDAITPSRRLFTPPAEIAATIVFLLSDAARGMYGSVVVVDEGKSVGAPLRKSSSLAA